MTDQPWTCTRCGDTLRGWTALDNHLRLMHPDVDRDVVDGDGAVRVDAEVS